MYPVKIPAVVKSLFPGLVWKMDSKDPVVYLTFDDGPTPGVTEFVLDELQRYEAKATFFCVGQNVESNPGLISEIREHGHTIGNHTYSHLSGWKSKDDDYLLDIQKCDDIINSGIFRPPYGRIKPSQAKRVSENFNVIMWDVLSGDFDESIGGEQCARNVLNNISNGSIIVFHDSAKAAPRLRTALPLVLMELEKNGFGFLAL